MTKPTTIPEALAELTRIMETPVALQALYRPTESGDLWRVIITGENFYHPRCPAPTAERSLWLLARESLDICHEQRRPGPAGAANDHDANLLTGLLRQMNKAGWGP
jgi:hypothetical protein